MNKSPIANTINQLQAAKELLNIPADQLTWQIQDAVWDSLGEAIAMLTSFQMEQENWPIGTIVRMKGAGGGYTGEIVGYPRENMVNIFWHKWGNSDDFVIWSSIDTPDFEIVTGYVPREWWPKDADQRLARLHEWQSRNPIPVSEPPL